MQKISIEICRKKKKKTKKEYGKDGNRNMKK